MIFDRYLAHDLNTKKNLERRTSGLQPGFESMTATHADQLNALHPRLVLRIGTGNWGTEKPEKRHQELKKEESLITGGDKKRNLKKQER